MKGIHGLIVALVLGMIGAVANYYYLSAEAQKVETVAFIGIKKGTIVGRGDRLAENSLAKVEIPKNRVGNLAEYAYLWTEMPYIKNDPVWRALDGGEDGILLLRSDLKTPPKELDLREGETVRWIPIESRSYVPSLITPGDKVSFILPKPRLVVPVKPPAEAPKPDPDNPATGEVMPKPDQTISFEPPGETEEIGPFEVVSVGNRLGDYRVMQAAKMPQLQETSLGIRVGPKNSKEWLAVNNLWDRLQAVNFRQVGIALHHRK